MGYEAELFVAPFVVAVVARILILLLGVFDGGIVAIRLFLVIREEQYIFVSLVHYITTDLEERRTRIPGSRRSRVGWEITRAIVRMPAPESRGPSVIRDR